jgi:hypothetical protein
MCLLVHVLTYTHKYTYMHTHTNIRTCIHTYMHTHIHRHIHTYIHTQEFYGMSSATAMKKHVGGVANYRASEGKHVLLPYKVTSIHTHIHTYIYIYIHTYKHTYIYTYIHTYIHTYIQGAVQNTVNDMLGGIRSTCTYVGAAELKSLSKRTTFIRVQIQTNEVFGHLHHVAK